MLNTKIELNQICLNRRILGISNTYLWGKPWLSHAEKDIVAMLENSMNLVLIPYALHDMDQYAAKLRETFRRMGIRDILSVHDRPGQEISTLEKAEAIYIAGGNTTRLLANLHALRHYDDSMVDSRSNAARHALIEIIRHKVAEGTPIIGSSAGINVLCADIRTTNDMHIALQKLENGQFISRMDALGLFPPWLNINPHFLEKIDLDLHERTALPETVKRKVCAIIDHQGESRTERLVQLLEMDPTRKILALREGAYIRVRGMRMRLKGSTGAVLLQHGRHPTELRAEEDLSYLLEEHPITTNF